MSGRVVVVGSVNVDLVVRLPRLPRPGETVTGGVLERHHGGKGANQAVAAARLGRPTLLVGAVGEDDFGLAARGALEAEGVGTVGVTTVADAATGVALILVDASGENLIGVASGANLRVDPAQVATALARLGPLAGDVLLTCHEVPTASVAAALDLARQAGAVTVLNPAPAAGLDLATVARADLVTPNRAELALLAEEADAERPLPPLRWEGGGEPVADSLVEAAQRLLGALPAAAPTRLLVTLGADGALEVARIDGDLVARRWPAFPVVPVDTTGAGDAFSGALAASLAAGHPWEAAVRRALAAGALATTRHGAREGMPTAAELEAFLAERGG
jgi:ribokinase